MKKILTLTLTLLLIFGIFSNAFAISSYSIKLDTPKSEISKNEEFTVSAQISDIADNLGIIIVAGKINYDQNSLTLVRIEKGDNTWDTPEYHKESGLFIIDREDRGKSTETLFKMIFRVNESSTKNPTISISNIEASNGENDLKTNNVSVSITVSDKSTTPSVSPTTSPTVTPSQEPTQSPKPTETNNPTESPIPTTNPSEEPVPTKNPLPTSKPSPSPSEKPNGIINILFPKTGKSGSTLFLLLIALLLIVVAIICYVKIKKINNKKEK